MKIVEKLNEFYNSFESLKDDAFLKNNVKNQSFFSKLFKTKDTKNQPIPLKGIYLWGGVGCGVSYFVSNSCLI